MPIYDLKCTVCGTREDHSLRVAELDSNRPTHCGAPMDVVLHAPIAAMVQAEARYRCPVTGQKVTTRRERRYLFEKHDLVDANDFASNREKTIKHRERARELSAKLYEGLPKEALREMDTIAKDELRKIETGAV